MHLEPAGAAMLGDSLLRRNWAQVEETGEETSRKKKGNWPERPLPAAPRPHTQDPTKAPSASASLWRTLHTEEPGDPGLWGDPG